MKYAGIIENDIAAAPGICVSFFTQGCPHHCPVCQNPETWDFNAGKDFNNEVLFKIIKALKANGVERKLCIMGGEPLCKENLILTEMVIATVRESLPQTEIYVWTGYTFPELEKQKNDNSHIQYILTHIDCLIDGKYIESERDVTLEMRGSKNQNIIYFSNKGEYY